MLHRPFVVLATTVLILLICNPMTSVAGQEDSSNATATVTIPVDGTEGVESTPGPTPIPTDAPVTEGTPAPGPNTDPSQQIGYRTLSAAVRIPMASFDYQKFLNSVCNSVAINATSNRCRIITYGPTTDPDVIIVDFAIVDDGMDTTANERTSAQAAELLVTQFTTLQPLSSDFVIDSLIYEPSLEKPEASAPITGKIQGYRFVSDTPFIVLVTLMSIMFIATSAYIIWHLVKGRKDKSLYARWTPTRTWLSCYTIGTVGSGDKFGGGYGEMGAQKLENMRHVSACAAGPNQTIVVSKGRTYVSGANSYGELGLGHKHPVSVLTINPFFSKRKPLRVVVGDNHTLVLTCAGLYSFGCGSDGALGHGDYNDLDVPKRIEFFQGKTIRGLAAGGSHSLVLTTDGLYSFGAGSEGQLMHGDGETYATPQLVQYFAGYEDNIRQLVCGAAHTFVLCSDWELYACGSNSCGQLALGHNEDVWEPEQVELPETTSYVYSVSSSYHTLIACDDGLYACGEGADCKLGDGEEKNCNELTWVSGLDGYNVVTALAGGEHSVAVTSDLQLFGWGRTTGGKLGDGEAEEVLVEPTFMDTSGVDKNDVLAAVVVGATCTLLITKEPENEDETDSDADEHDPFRTDGREEKKDGGEAGKKKQQELKKNPLDKYKA